MNERQGSSEYWESGRQSRKGSASEGASVERTKKRSQGEPPSRRRPWTTFLIATSSRSSLRSHQHASELLRTIRTKGKQFSVDAAADAYLVTPSNLLHSHPLCHDVRLPSSLSHVKSLRLFLPSHGGQLLPPTLSSCPLSAFSHPPRAIAACLHGPPLFSVQQVARSFKTCRRSFVRFKKPKHQQSSALRRQDRYPHREQSSGMVRGRKMR